MQDDFLGRIQILAFTYAPAPAYAFCSGQTVPVSQNPALYSLLGLRFGGDGKVNFGLPDLRGRVPVGASSRGAPDGLTARPLGSKDGTYWQKLQAANLPLHTHSGTINLQNAVAINSSLEVVVSGATTATPAAGAHLAGGGGKTIFGPSTSGHQVALAGLEGGLEGSVSVGKTGLGEAFYIASTALGVNFAICTSGIYPQRP